MVRDFECVVLGSGGSSGVPAIGCACAACTSEDPRDRRLRTSAAVRFTDPQGQSRTLLIDTSPDLRAQALRAGLRRCDAIFYTHHHVDHTFGLDEVRRFSLVMNGEIDLFADTTTLAFLERVYQHIFRRDPAPGSFVAALAAKRLRAGQAVDRYGLRLLPIPLLHGGVPILGFRIDALDGGGGVAATQPAPLPLAWCTDVSGIPPASWPLLTGLRTLVLGMLRHRRHPAHYSVDEAVHVAGEIDAAETWFVHMTHDIVHREVDAALPERMRLAWDGLVLGTDTSGR